MQPEAYDRSRLFGQAVLASGGSGLRIAITMDDRLSGSPTAQLIALALINLLPRVGERYTTIDLCVPQQKVSIPRILQGDDFGDYLIQEAKSICPWGRFSQVRKLTHRYDCCLVIGRDTPATTNHLVHLLSSGWRCFVSEVGPFEYSASTFNSFACLAAAAIAVMFVYRRAENISLPGLHPTGHVNGWSLLTYGETRDDGPSLPVTLDLHEIKQAGLGGTGNALLWALQFGPELTGVWQAFENEIADLTNWNRYLLMKVGDVGMAKSEVARQRFGNLHDHLDFTATPEAVDSSYDLFPTAATVLATVDDPRVRIHLQRHSRQVLLNVGTNCQYLGVWRHEFSGILKGEPCIECLYGDTERMDRRTRESTVSFVLALAGAVLGAELVKRYVYPEFGLSNAWLGNIFCPSEARPIRRTNDPDCETCRSLKLEIENRESRQSFMATDAGCPILD